MLPEGTGLATAQTAGHENDGTARISAGARSACRGDVYVRVPLPLVCVAGLFAAACGSSATTNVTSVAGPSTIPARCAVTLTTPTSSFGPGGGTSSVNVSTERECAWTASPQSPWIEITAGKDGSGNG